MKQTTEKCFFLFKKHIFNLPWKKLSLGRKFGPIFDDDFIYHVNIDDV